MRFSLIKKLSFFTIGFITIISIGTSFGLYNITKGEIENLERNNLMYTAAGLAQGVDHKLNNAQQELEAVAKRKEIIDYLKLDDREPQDPEILQNFHYHNYRDNYAAIYLMDNNGVVWASTDARFVGEDYSFRPYFQNAINNGYYHDISIGVTSGELGYYFARSITDETGETLGVLTIKLKTESLYNPLEDRISEDGTDIILVDRFGVVIYAVDKNKMYHSLGGVSQEARQYIEDTKRFAGEPLDSLGYSDLYNFLQSKTTLGIFEFYNKENDKNEIFAAVKISSYPYTLILAEDEDNFLAIAVRSAQKLSLAIVFVSFFISLLVYYFISRLLMPLDVLQDGINKIEQGDLTHRVSIKTNDELQDIGEGFNKMASQLDKNIHKIESQVLERTKTLEDLNKHMVGRELKMLELKRKIKSDKEN